MASLGRSREHEILLPELESGKKYYYKRELWDASNNIAIDDAPGFFTTTNQPDETPPLFVSGPVVPYSTDDRALFVWRTDEATTGAVYYRRVGVDEFAESVSSRVMSLKHTVLVTGLRKSQPYDFAVVATDAGGRTTTVPENTVVVKTARGVKLVKSGRDAGRLDGGTFTTAVAPDAAAPVITDGPVVESLNKSAALITWNTDEPSDSRVRFVQGDVTTSPARLARGAGRALSDENEVAERAETTEHIMTIDVGADTGTYSYQVLSRDPSGNETLSEAFAFTVTGDRDVNGPEIIDGPTIISRTESRVVVRWMTNEAADSRIVIRELEAADLDQLTTNVPDQVTEHIVTLTNLKPTTDYRYLASSTDPYGNGSAKVEKTFQTASDADVAAPSLTTEPSVVSFDDITARIAWVTDEAADTYIEYGGSAAYGFVAQDPTKATAHEILLTNLTAGATYHYRVQAEDASGNVFVQSTDLTFTTASTADVISPAIPADLSVAAGNGAIHLAWTGNTESDLAGYNIQRSTGNESGYATIASNVQDASFMDRTVTNGVEYYYRINAVDGSRQRNASDFTATVAATHATPAANLGPAAPPIVDYTYYPGLAGYPVFMYYDLSSGKGEPYRPVLRVPNVPDVAQPGMSMSYTFVVATDADFQKILVTGSNIPPGDSLVGAFDSWLYAWMRLDSTQRDNTRMTAVDDSTSWIPTANLTPGTDYFWKVRANDGIFDGPWSATQAFADAAIEFLDPARAEYLGIQLRPEEPAEVIVAVQLEMFAATSGAGGINVSWQLAQAADAMGVRLVRSVDPTDDASFAPVMKNLQPLDGRYLDASVIPDVTYYYRVEVLSKDGTTERFGMLAARVSGPSEFALGANHPNPFNPSTVIPYVLPDQSVVTLSVFDVSGRLVRTVLSGTAQRQGYYRASWDGLDNLGRAAASGVYVYRLERVPVDGAQPASLLGRMVLVR
jgi:fibronectin type 3 domain-containing protein